MRKPCPLFCLCLLLGSTASLAADKTAAMASDARLDDAACKAVPTGPGPHSLLPLPGTSRLLIASHDRRHFERAGAIQDFDTRTQTLRTLPRSGEPAGFVLRPHHMDSVTKNGETLLHVISHDEATPNGTQHSIAIYKLEADRLLWRTRLHDPLLSSPNHLSIAADGDIYVSNDRRDGSSIMELALRLGRGNVVRYRASLPDGQRWRLVADGLNFPNGVKAESNLVLVPLSFGNTLLSFPRLTDGTLGTPRELVKLPALDGLNPGPDAGSHLVVSHGPLLDFLRHQKDSKKLSSGIVYLINTDSGRTTPFFSDDGRRISAMSNAVLAGNALYIGQSFDSFMLRCPMR